MTFDIDITPLKRINGSFEFIEIGGNNGYIIKVEANILAYCSPSSLRDLDFNQYTTYEVSILTPINKFNVNVPRAYDFCKFAWKSRFELAGISSSDYHMRYCTRDELKTIIKDIESLYVSSSSFFVGVDYGEGLSLPSPPKSGGKCKRCGLYDDYAILDNKGECLCYNCSYNPFS
jgi:hypothetical protein